MPINVPDRVNKLAQRAFFQATANFLSHCPNNVPLGTGEHPTGGAPQSALGKPQGFPTWVSGNNGIAYRDPNAQKNAMAGFFSGSAFAATDGVPCKGCRPPVSNNGACPVIS
jgi:hypothetical protein